MTIYLKEINGVLTPAPEVYTDENGFYPAFNQNISEMINKGYSSFDENDYAQYVIGAKIFENGSFVDKPTEAFVIHQKNAKIYFLQKQIEELDKKCIRAMREPSVKDETAGQTWLEFYTEQIQELRNQLAQLNLN